MNGSRRAAAAAWLAIVLPAPAVAAPPAGERGTDAADLRRQAFDLQIDGTWCEAVAAWDAVLKRLPDDAALRREAETNRGLVRQLCQPAEPPVKEAEVAPLPPEKRPPAVSEDDLLRYYPVGRKQRSVAQLHVRGSGSNADWLWKVGARFQYVYVVAVETEVVEQSGRRVTFRQRFAEVSQQLAVSEREIELVGPDDPLAQIAWEAADDSLRVTSPAYVVVRKAAEIANTADPGLKRTLTGFAKQLERAGVPLPKSEDVQFFAKVDKLQGLELEMLYYSGLGVRSVRVVNGNYDPKELREISASSGLLLDYYVFPGAKQPPGARWTVRAEDVAGMLALAAPGDGIDGELTLERKADAQRQGATVAVLAARPGDAVRLTRDTDRGETSVRATVKAATILFSPQDLTVVEAEVKWSGATDSFSKDHLLFGTKRLRDVHVESKYFAERLDAPAAGKGQR